MIRFREKPKKQPATINKPANVKKPAKRGAVTEPSLPDTEENTSKKMAALPKTEADNLKDTKS